MTEDFSHWDAFYFSGTAGQQVTITMASSAVNAYLMLLRPDARTSPAPGGSSTGSTTPKERTR